MFTKGDCAIYISLFCDFDSLLGYFSTKIQKNILQQKRKIKERKKYSQPTFLWELTFEINIYVYVFAILLTFCVRVKECLILHETDKNRFLESNSKAWKMYIFNPIGWNLKL